MILLDKYYSVEDAEHSLVAEPMEILAGKNDGVKTFNTRAWVDMLDNIMSIATNMREYFFDNSEYTISEKAKKNIEKCGMSVCLGASIAMVVDLVEAGRLVGPYAWLQEGQDSVSFDRDLHRAFSILEPAIDGAIDTPHHKLTFIGEIGVFYNDLVEWIHEWENDEDYTNFAGDLVNYILHWSKAGIKHETKMKYLTILLGLALSWLIAFNQEFIVNENDELEVDSPAA